MEDIISHIHQAVDKDLAVLATTRDKMTSSQKDIEELVAKLPQMRSDVRVITERTQDTKFAEYCTVKMKAIEQYAKRVDMLTGMVVLSVPRVQQFGRRLKVQVSMLSAQLKYYAELSADEALLRAVSDNIKSIIELTKKLSSRTVELHSNTIVASELFHQSSQILLDLDERIGKFKQKLGLE